MTLPKTWKNRKKCDVGNVVKVELYAEILEVEGDFIYADLYAKDGEKLVRTALKPEDIKRLCQKTPKLNRNQRI